MKLKDLSVGDYVTGNRIFEGLILDIGMFGPEYVAVGHTINWRGITIEARRSWYSLNDSVQKRRIIIVALNGSIQSVSPSQVDQIMTIDYVREKVAKATLGAIEGDDDRRLVQRKEDYNSALSETMKIIVEGSPMVDAGLGVRSNRGNPWETLAQFEVIKQMTMLWLRYQQQADTDFNQNNDVESLVESLRDCVKGREENSREWVLSKDRDERQRKLDNIMAGLDEHFGEQSSSAISIAVAA